MIKKIVTLLFILSLGFGKPFAQSVKAVDLNDYILKTGDTLVYEVNKGGKSYLLFCGFTGPTFIDGKIVNDISYDWKTVGDTVMQGSVSISKRSQLEADIYQPELVNGPLVLKKKSCLWLSLNNFQSLFSPDGAELDLGDGHKVLYRIIEGMSERYTILFKGKPAWISTFRVKSKDSPGLFTIWSGTVNTNRLIMSFDIGWTMKLKEIR